MVHFPKTLEDKTQDFESTQREMEFLCKQNASLAKQMNDFVCVNLRAIVESFVNVLQ